jgi:5-methylcytosine-specific restriction endonuclease McrA
MSGRPYDLRRWRRIRKLQLAREPLCRMCGRTATDVDHIRPLADGGAFDDPANLRSLCHECHSRVTRAWQNGKPEPSAQGSGPGNGIAA